LIACSWITCPKAPIESAVLIAIRVAVAIGIGMVNGVYQRKFAAEAPAAAVYINPGI
jgi:hypothetical protein